MENKNDELKQAIEQVVGEHIDNFMIIASNNDNGLDLQAATGNMAVLAFQMAKVLLEHPDFEDKIKSAKSIVSGELDDQIKEVLSRLGKVFGGAEDDE